jgi:diadenosine tetraphosphate (Ap4A) HIT family hydrolase
LPDEYHDAVWQTVRKLAAHMDKVLNKRIFIKVIGTDVPHAHIHLIPQDENYSDKPIQTNDQELSVMAEQLRMV